MRPNIFLGTCEGSTQYKKWYFEMMVDQVEPFVTAQASHLRVGWALTEGYSPYPGGERAGGATGWATTCTPTALTGCTSGQVSREDLILKGLDRGKSRAGNYC